MDASAHECTFKECVSNNLLYQACINTFDREPRL